MKEFKDYTILRSNIYNILAFPFYKEPDETYLEDVKTFLPYFKNIAELSKNAEMAEGSKILEEYFKTADLKAEQEELACAYARLFLVADMKAGVKGVSAHESVYTSKDGLLMQDARDEVLGAYYSESLANNTEVFSEMEDHISAEMSFLGYFCTQTVEAIDKNDGEAVSEILRKQKDFLEKHPLVWIDRLASDVVEVAPSQFYKGIAKLTQGFLHTEKNILDSLLA